MDWLLGMISNIGLLLDFSWIKYLTISEKCLFWIAFVVTVGCWFNDRRQIQIMAQLDDIKYNTEKHNA
jgi:hypothetical protein